MAKTVFVHCTLSNSQKYVIYEPFKKGDAVLKVAKDTHGNPLVLNIEGGANVSKNLITIEGVVTEVDKDLVERFRKECELFALHEKNGFITVKDVHRIDVRDMEKKDGSAQLTKSDYKKKGRKAPKTAMEANSETGGDDDE